MVFDPDLNVCYVCQNVNFEKLEKSHGLLGPLDPDDEQPTLRLDESNNRKEIYLPFVLHDKLPDLPALQQAANEKGGCEVGACALFRHVLQKGQIDHRGDIALRFQIRWGDRSGYHSYGLLYLRVDVCPIDAATEKLTGTHIPVERALKSFMFDICSQTCDPDCVSRWLKLRPSEDSAPLTQRNIHFLQDAIRNCESNCSHNIRQTGFLPTRLLDLQPEDPRLVVSRDATNPLQSSTQYAALSYCWGPPSDAKTQLKTENATLPKHQAGIPLHTMTTVMQDAVRTCRALSIRYLWIDALCIVQDDTADWEVESKTMGSVYRFAHVVLCAAASTTCHNGFLTRARRVEIPYHSPLRADVRGSYALVARGEWHLGAPEAAIIRDTWRTSWGRRGWVFQERLLSTRRIIFGENMVHFECGRFVNSENGDRSEPKDDQGCLSEEMLAAAEAIKQKTHNDEEISKKWIERLYYLFRLSVRLYSTSLLTFETDRLPAFSGMAEIVSDGTGDTYLAGLWRGNLESGLLWYAEPGHSSMKECIAKAEVAVDAVPSWAWASQSKMVHDPRDTHNNKENIHLRAEFTVVNAFTKVTGGNPFGSVRGGELRLRSRLKILPSDLKLIYNMSTHLLASAPYSLPASMEWNLSSKQAQFHMTCWLDWKWDLTEDFPLQLKLLLISSSTPLRYVIYSNDYSSSLQRYDSSTITVRKDELAEDECLSKQKPQDAWGLLLYKSSQPGKYHRVGVFVSHVTQNDPLGGTNYFLDQEPEDVCLT